MSQITSCHSQKKTIQLPVIVDSHAVACEWDDNLWVLINRFSEQKTDVYKIDNDHQITLAAELPMMSSTVTSCESQLIVTGSTSEGAPVVSGINSEGVILWSHIITDIKPVIWPVSACGNEIFLAWQETVNVIATGQLNPATKSFRKLDKMEISSPPARLQASKRILQAIWNDNEHIYIKDLINKREITLNKSDGYEDNLQVGFVANRQYFTWATKDHVHFQWSGDEKINSVKMDNPKGGDLRALRGDEPLAWIQYSELDIDDKLTWNSILALPGDRTYAIDEYVFALSWWKDAIVVVHPSRIEILEKR